MKNLIQDVMLRSCCSASQQLNRVEALNKNAFRATRCVGFTLIELLVVVLIIGILSAIALPQYQKTVEKAKATQAMILVSSVVEAVKVYYLANGTYPTKFDELDVQVPFIGNTHSYTYNPSIDHTDWKSNDDWSMMIYTYGTSGGYGIMCLRNSGPYKGGVIMYYFYRSWGDAPLNQLICIEDPGAGFTATHGSFCVKLLGGKSYEGSDIMYTLPT